MTASRPREIEDHDIANFSFTVSSISTSLSSRTPSRHTGNQKYPGADVYCPLLDKLNAGLRNILQGASELQGETRLNYYSDQWPKYRVMVRLLDHGCAYFTRHWVTDVVQKRRDIYIVEALALSRWKVVMVDGVQGDDRRLSKALLDLVSSYRANQSTYLAAVKSVLASLAIPGRPGEHGEVATPDVYQDVFEDAFLGEATKHYKQQVEPAEKCVQGAWSWLAVEGAFEAVLPTLASFAKLQTIIKDLLITARADELETYMSGAIRDARHEDLKGFYSASVHHPDAVELVRETFIQLFHEAVSPAEGDVDATATESEVKRNSEVEDVYVNIVRDDFKIPKTG